MIRVQAQGKEGGDANRADIKINKFTNHEGVLTQNQFNGDVLNLALVHGEALVIDPKIKIKNESKIDKQDNTDDRFTNEKKVLTNILAATDSSQIAGKFGKFRDTVYRIPLSGQPEDQKTLIQHHFFDGRQGMIMQNQYNSDYSALSGAGLIPHLFTADRQNNDPSGLLQRKLDAKHAVKSIMEKYQNLVDHALKDYDNGGRKSETISTGSRSFDLSKVLSQVKNIKIDSKNVRVQDYTIKNGEKKLFFDETRLPLAVTAYICLSTKLETYRPRKEEDC
uniref:Uncharacterized protein n=1 Tax=Romanomermis culicivorax TaxID=13658 RepID=A0A915HX26_ROMCU